MANEVLLINPRKPRRRRPVRRRRRRNPNNAARSIARVTSGRVGVTRRANQLRPLRRRPVGRRPIRARRSIRAYRRNPAGGRMTMRSVMNQIVMPSFQAGLGALALDVAWGFVPVPLEWKVGNLRHVVKGGGAIVLGMIAQQMLGAQMGRNIAMGALTVTFHDAMRDMVAQFAPNIPLGYIAPAMNAGDYGSPQTYNYPGGEPMLQGQGQGLGYYVEGGPGAAPPMPVKRETENMGYYTT